jgi:hypothetical protein
MNWAFQALLPAASQETGVVIYHLATGAGSLCLSGQSANGMIARKAAAPRAERVNDNETAGLLI